MSDLKSGKTYVCRKMYLYFWLTRHGFEPYCVRPDMYNCKRNVWLYTETPELRASVEEFFDNGKEL